MGEPRAKKAELWMGQPSVTAFFVAHLAHLFLDSWLVPAILKINEFLFQFHQKLGGATPQTVAVIAQQ